MTEPVFTVERFNQAANRLEVMRGILDVPNKLIGRLLRRFAAINVTSEGKNFRMFYMDPKSG